MSEMPWVRFFPSDWLGGTRGMSAAETGIYITLIASMYERGEPVPEEPARLARLCGASNSAFKTALESLISEGKIRRVEGGLWNDRVEKEGVYRAEKSEVARSAGRASGVARAGRNQELRAMRLKDARQKGSHTILQWTALVAACDAQCVSCGSPDSIEKDHIVPIYQGGSDGIDNLQPLCRSCNARKGPDNSDLRPKNWRVRFDALCLSLGAKSEENQSEIGTDVEREMNVRSTNQKPEPEPEKRKEEISSDEGEFAAWYESFPKHEGKGSARRAYRTARKKASAEVLLAAARAASVRFATTEAKYIPLPASWLNAERWLDETQVSPRRKPDWRLEPEYRGVR